MTEDFQTYESLPDSIQQKISKQDFEAWGITGKQNIFCSDSTVALDQIVALAAAGYFVDIVPADNGTYWLHAVRLGRGGSD